MPIDKQGIPNRLKSRSERRHHVEAFDSQYGYTGKLNMITVMPYQTASNYLPEPWVDGEDLSKMNASDNTSKVFQQSLLYLYCF